MRACVCVFTARDELKKFALFKGAEKQESESFFFFCLDLGCGAVDLTIICGEESIVLLLGSFMTLHALKNLGTIFGILIDNRFLGVKS